MRFKVLCIRKPGNLNCCNQNTSIYNLGGGGRLEFKNSKYRMEIPEFFCLKKEKGASSMGGELAEWVDDDYSRGESRV